MYNNQYRTCIPGSGKLSQPRDLDAGVAKIITKLDSSNPLLYFKNKKVSVN